MNYSMTYVGVGVMILGFIFQAAGVPFSEGTAETTIKFIVEVVGVLTALYGRYRAGGVGIFGNKV